MTFIEWWHHFTNPHCADCALERIESKACNSCEVLKMQLDIANTEKRKLLDSILVKPIEEVSPEVNYKEIKPRTVPWNVRRQQLEAEDRIKANLLKNKQVELKNDDKELEELEKEMEMDNEADESA